MWGNDGRGSPPPSSVGMPGPARPTERRMPGRLPKRADMAEDVSGADSANARTDPPDVEGMESMTDADTRMEFPIGAASVDSPAFRRMRARRAIREFLRSMPRSEATEALTFLRPDGEPRSVTRAEISAAVDCMRPRMRRIIRLAVEEHWPRKRVCAHLGISIKTYERDHVEALDALVDM